MHWNNRVMKHTTVHKDGTREDWYAIHEVYYGDNYVEGSLDGLSWTKDHVAVIGDDLEDLELGLRQQLQALSKPVLDYDKLEKYYAAKQKKEKKERKDFKL